MFDIELTEQLFEPRTAFGRRNSLDFKHEDVVGNGHLRKIGASW
jgi:hypothetical protein